MNATLPVPDTEVFKVPTLFAEVSAAVPDPRLICRVGALKATDCEMLPVELVVRVSVPDVAVTAASRLMSPPF